MYTYIYMCMYMYMCMYISWCHLALKILTQFFTFSRECFHELSEPGGSLFFHEQSYVALRGEPLQLYIVGYLLADVDVALFECV